MSQLSDHEIAEQLKRYHQRRSEAPRWGLLHIITGVPMGVSIASGKLMFIALSFGAFLLTGIMHASLRLPNKTFMQRLEQEGYMRKSKRGDYYITYKGELYDQRAHDKASRFSRG